MKSKIKIQPLHDRVVIEPAEVKKTTESGIIIPDSVRDKPIQGTVMAVGKGINGDKLTVKAGDEVLYGKHAGMPVVVEEKSYLIMKETDILAII